MKILALDTSSHHASFALVEENRCLAELYAEIGTRHSERMIGEIDNLLALVLWDKQDLDALVVGLGPGSFTGLRVGLATAQGLSFALERPLYGISSLDAMAQAAPNGPSLLATCVDARKKELYVRFYRRSLPNPTASESHTGSNKHTKHPLPLLPPKPLSAHMLLSPDAFAEALQEWEEDVLLVGSGASLYRDQLQTAVQHQIYLPYSQNAHRISASQMARLAMPTIIQGKKTPTHLVQPIYIRPSDAEINIGPPTGGPPLKGRLTPDGKIRSVPIKAREDR